ncbi:hypothetical protein NKJ26_25965 [Mesorhizobium sp. M0152]
MFDLVNTIRGEPAISFEFVARQPDATTTPGISFQTRREPSRRMDVLILLAMPGMQIPELVASLEKEARHAASIIARAQREDAIIAGHCGAGYFLAGAGLLDGKRATISWWLKTDARRRFPKVRWDASRVLVQEGRIYTCGGGFSGLELGRALLRDLGFAEEERLVRKLLVLPPSRQVQTPYEFPCRTCRRGNLFATGSKRWRKNNCAGWISLFSAGSSASLRGRLPVGSPTNCTRHPDAGFRTSASTRRNRCWKAPGSELSKSAIRSAIRMRRLSAGCSCVRSGCHPANTGVRISNPKNCRRGE